MKRFAQVIDVKGQTATVRVTKHSSCDKCGECSNADDLTLTVTNDIEAKAGDMVTLEMKGSNISSAAVVVYLVPILGLIGGYILAPTLGLVAEGFKIMLGLLFMLLSFITARKFGDYKQEEYTPQITEVV
ncbi:Positive regulator of sigma E activity [Halobacteroides halobius DSM 5150]|uniref:Positive regulator of sigma E activity n=1 Tax=Halobacteroides halobius (strain ATCC 35273 / DSM 5150 / MD-1) TaxID=748449 RepID=L0KCB3_HALHC|nr:SoxR reducing system RseC family protein [Halobacteroides halobius]AGB42014.1 Positive regulator of sigma E activity [Halobacteroides halobius DSM 5150]